MEASQSKASRYKRIAEEAVEAIGVASRLIDEISRGHETFRLYDSDHRNVEAATDKIMELVDELLSHRRSITIDVGIRRFLINHLPIFETSKGAGSLHDTFHKMEIGGLTFTEGINEEQVVQFVGLLSGAIASNKNRHWLDRKLEGAGVNKIFLELPNIEVLAQSKNRKKAMETDDFASADEEELSLVQSVLSEEVELAITNPRMLYQLAAGQVRHILYACDQPDQIAPDDVARVAKGIAGHCHKKPNEMIALAVSGHFDDYACVHPVNVAIFSALLAGHILQDEKDLDRIVRIALLYDVGMSRVPREWSEKSDPLTQEEQDKIREHALFSADMLDRRKAIEKLCVIVGFEHHQDDQGNGYPRGSVSNNTNLATRIIRVAEAVDALIGNANYRKPVAPKAAMQQLLDQWKGTTEGALLARLIRLIGIYPAGSIVTLTSGETGIVIDQAPKQLAFPIVRVIVNKNGELIESGSRLQTGKDVFVSDALPVRKFPVDPLDYFPFH